MPPCPRRCPNLRAGRSPPSTSLLERWEETSTTSTFSRKVGWESWWATQRAKGYLQRWLCPPPAVCCSSPLEPWTPPRPVRYWPRSTRRCLPASPPICSSPASTLSSTQTVVGSPTPTQATTCLTYTRSEEHTSE